MKSETVSIKVADYGEVSGVVSSPDRPDNAIRMGVIVAHGAGNDMHHPLLVALCDGLADAGCITLRFNFLYKEKGKRAPDSQSTLVKTWVSVYQYFKDKFEDQIDFVIIAGKSMGGRVASQMVADGMIEPDRLIFLGYPLHAPGKKDQLRDSHLYNITVPMLFFAGTRDALCDLALLKDVLKKITIPWELEIVEGGNHSFDLPKADTRTCEAVYRQIHDKSLAWIRNKNL
jgi:hypothetical protein